MSFDEKIKLTTRIRHLPQLTASDLYDRDESVRVFRHTPERVELQIRTAARYAQSSLTIDQARELAEHLLDAAADADGAQFCAYCLERVPAPCVERNEAAGCQNMRAAGQFEIGAALRDGREQSETDEPGPELYPDSQSWSRDFT